MFRVDPGGVLLLYTSERVQGKRAESQPPFQRSIIYYSMIDRSILLSIRRAHNEGSRGGGARLACVFIWVSGTTSRRRAK